MTCLFLVVAGGGENGEDPRTQPLVQAGTAPLEAGTASRQPRGRA